MATWDELDGKRLQMVPTDPCAWCMFTTMACGTSFTGKVVLDKEDKTKATMVDNTYCFCIHPSPIPCFMCCGYGPCAMAPRMKKISDTKMEGTGESVLAGRCCACMFHDLGDVIEYKDGKWLMTPGNSPAYPPCFQGKTIAYMKVIGADRYKGAAPEGTEMER